MANLNLRVWLTAARPRTLTAAITPVIVGSALAYRANAFNPWAALVCLLGAVFLQIGANLANDVYDFKKGADVNRVGPPRVTATGLLSPRAVEIGMWIVFGLAAVCGLYLVYLGGWPIVLIGLASVAAGIAYTGGPFPLGYNGLGDVFTFVFFGPVAVIGTYYVQAGAPPLPVIMASLPMGALITNILVVNNVRDAETDRAAGKRTLAVLLGRPAARAEYYLMIVLAYLTPALLLTITFNAWIVLPLVSLPIAIRLKRIVSAADDGPTLNRALAGSAQLVALYGILFAAGIVAG